MTLDSKIRFFRIDIPWETLKMKQLIEMTKMHELQDPMDKYIVVSQKGFSLFA